MKQANLALLDLSEKEWDYQLFGSQKGLATILGFSSYHVLRSKGSQAGFPDRTLWRERLILVELKREGGKPTETQRTVLTALAKAGAEVYLWTPSDLDEIGRILAMRTVFVRSELGQPGGLWVEDGVWTPGCLWCVHGHRVDEEAGV